MVLFLLVYVDDIIIGGEDNNEITDIKFQLQNRFKTRDLGTVKYFLGLEIARNATGIHISQKKYASEIIQAAGLLGCKPVVTPIEQNVKYEQNSSRLLKNPTFYRKLLGKLIYLTITRPGITMPRSPRRCSQTDQIHQSRYRIRIVLFIRSRTKTDSLQ